MLTGFNLKRLNWLKRLGEEKKSLISRSLVQQAQFAIFAATIPLILLTLWFAYSLNQASSDVNRIYIENHSVEVSLRALRDTLSNLEKAQMNNQLLQDNALSETIQAKWQEIKKSALLLKSHTDKPALVAKWQQFMANLPEDSQTAPDFLKINSQFEQLSTSIRTFLSVNLNKQHDAFEQTRITFFTGFALLIPVLIVMSLFLVRRLSDKLFAIENATTQLGLGHWQEPISLSGSHELQQLGKRLDWLRIALIRQEQEKETFLRHVSHELKTPLASIVEGSSLLSGEVLGPLTAQQLRVLGIITRSSTHLKSLIEDLLTYSSIARLGGQGEAKAVSELQAELVQYFTEQQRSHEVEIHWTISPEIQTLPYLPCKLALTQLLSNALKFANSQIQVQICVLSRQDNIAQCQIRVLDDGRGFSETAAERAFEPFYRDENETHNSSFATGLGLAIVAECAIALGGQCQIVPGQGGDIAIDFTYHLTPSATPQTSSGVPQ
ncbi:sensor histidine kinase [Pseudoalteromonas fenneropenaei]|uniref:histidine kinase n=1 Tax=Pseudoalteromonas fenneropenaei TaxID=1737459 RepID=A0ABV7CG70_9GAMM